jgi:hypothetical protein
MRGTLKQLQVLGLCLIGMGRALWSSRWRIALQRILQ